MIPDIDILTTEITEPEYPNRTYRIVSTVDNMAVWKNRGTLSLSMLRNVTEIDRIQGYIDDMDAVIQAIYLILSTERYQYVIYSWDYGVELVDLFGKPMPYVIAELPRRITDALTQDNRIDDVVDFEFEKNGNKLHTTFTVVTNIGNVSSELEVEV